MLLRYVKISIVQSHADPVLQNTLPKRYLSKREVTFQPLLFFRGSVKLRGCIPLTTTVLLLKIPKDYISVYTQTTTEVYLPFFQSNCYRLYYQPVTDGAHPWTTAAMPETPLRLLQGFRVRPAHQASSPARNYWGIWTKYDKINKHVYFLFGNESSLSRNCYGLLNPMKPKREVNKNIINETLALSAYGPYTIEAFSTNIVLFTKGLCNMR